MVGTPALRPDHVARLARAYYHADPQVINESSERAEDGTWHYRDPRMQRVADGLVRAELTQCAHRNRPLRHDGRVVVTLCAGDILDLPVTTEITSLPQLTPEGMPLALARQAAEDIRLANAATALESQGLAVTSRALAETARISLNTACAWLRTRRIDTTESLALLSTMQYSPYCTADNASASAHPGDIAALGNSPASREAHEECSPEPQAGPSPGQPRQPAQVDACFAASHQLLWRWTAGAWHCPLCSDHTLQHSFSPPWGG